MKSICNLSKTEIKRRITAYTTLITSFLISLIIFSFNYIILYWNIAIYIILVLALILFGTRVIVIRYFKSIINNKIILYPKYIDKNKVKLSYKDIKEIVIKRTSPGYIREIKLVFNNNVTFINGIDNFEEFNKELQSKLANNVKIKNIKERIDFDHPLFYFFLGIILSIVTIISLKLLLILNLHQLNIIYYLVSITSILLGLYFIITKPIYKRDTKKKQITDYIWGLFFIITGVLVLTLCIL